MQYPRIATEEAFATPELFTLFRRMLANKTIQDPGFLSLWGFYLGSPSARATQIIERLQDIGERRVADMDATGIDLQILQRGLDGAIYGFGVDTGMHLLSIITSGAFDRFPKLQLVVGHLGEALPFWLFRLDYMHRATVNSKRYAFMKPLQRQVSDYMKENVYVTSSGMAWAPAIQFCQQVLGVDRVLYAMDYPYQFEASEVTEMDTVGAELDRRKFYELNARKVFKL